LGARVRVCVREMKEILRAAHSRASYFRSPS